MGGNQDENGSRNVHNFPPYLGDRLERLSDTAKINSLPDFCNQQQLNHNTPSSSTSYFSTLQIPQTFSFEQNFERTNALISRGVPSHECLPFGSNLVQRQTLCPEYPRATESFQCNPGQSTSPEAMLNNHPGRIKSSRVGRTASSLKRQKYLEKRRNTSSCWPVQMGKRSSYSDDEDEGISLQPVRKVFVNEEKMAARFDGLSLSHGCSYGSKFAEAKRIMADIDSRLSDSDIEEEEQPPQRSGSPGGQRLQMSASLKTALRRSKPEVLPERIAKKIANPCTAMILWQPTLPAPVDDDPLPQRKDDTQEMEMVDRNENIERPLPSRGDWPVDGEPDEHMEL